MHGDKIFALVRTDAGGAAAPGHLDAADRHAPAGVEARPLKQMSGRSEFGEVFFTDARVPVSEVLGDRRRRLATAMLLLSFERGASAIGQYTEFRSSSTTIVDLARKLGTARPDPVLRQTAGRACSPTWSACGYTRCTCSRRSSRAGTSGSRRR